MFQAGGGILKSLKHNLILFGEHRTRVEKQNITANPT